MPSRRRILISAALATGAASMAAVRYWPEQGWANPCRASLPDALARSEVVQAAWDGVDPKRCWDSHVHLIGTGDSGSGIWLNPRMQSLRHPGEYARRLFFLNAGCAHDAPGRIDESYIERMHNLLDVLPPGVKLILLAFDHSYGDNGERDLERTAFHTPNEYAWRLANAHPRYFEWAASIHPYRQDCVQALEWAAQRAARAVKWLPPAMGIDPASPRCDRFYAALARIGLPLITHAGEERAVHGANQSDFGNPLKLRRALDHGVRVVVAHCASVGRDRDLDQGPEGPWTDSFALFTRLMDEPRYVGRLYGDISAITQLNRAGPPLRYIVEREDWHARLVNGSDYPLPGIMPLFSVDALTEQGMIDARVAPDLKAIRDHNPLLFDFVLKRHLRSGGRRLANAVFHTREFFRSASRSEALGGSA